MTNRTYDLPSHMFNIERMKLPPRAEAKSKLPMRVREIALELNGNPTHR